MHAFLGINLTNPFHLSLGRTSHFFSKEKRVTGGYKETKNRSTNFILNHSLPLTSHVIKDNQNRLDSFFPKYILQNKVFDNNENRV